MEVRFPGHKADQLQLGTVRARTYGTKYTDHEPGTGQAEVLQAKSRCDILNRDRNTRYFLPCTNAVTLMGKRDTQDVGRNQTVPVQRAVK